MRALALPAASLLRKQAALGSATRLLVACLERAPAADELQLMLAEVCSESGDAARAVEHAEQLLARVREPALRARALLCAATSLVAVGKPGPRRGGAR